jgi:hypothetical protein
MSASQVFLPPRSRARRSRTPASGISSLSCPTDGGPDIASGGLQNQDSIDFTTVDDTMAAEASHEPKTGGLFAENLSASLAPALTYPPARGQPLMVLGRG